MKLLSHAVDLMLATTPAPAVAADDAPSRTFEFRHTATIPAMRGEGSARVWLPVPRSLPAQDVHVPTVESPIPDRLTRDAQFGNTILAAEGPATAHRSLPTMQALLIGMFVALIAPASPARGDAMRAGPTGGEGADSRDAKIQALTRQVEFLTRNQSALLVKLDALEKRIDGQTGDTKTSKETAAAPADKEAQRETERIKTEEATKKAAPRGGKPALKPYGFARLDTMYDTARLSNRIDPLFVQPVNAVGIRPKAAEFVTTPRLSRLGLDYSGAKTVDLGQARLSGKIEIDFDNGGTESREIPRIRLAYAQADWQEMYLLAGQAWDLIGPLNPSADPFTLLWDAGNVGDRRPQLRLGYQPHRRRAHRGGQWEFATAAALTGAVDAQDLDGNGRPDGEESGNPMIQGRIGWTDAKPADPARDALALGLWGMTARQQTSVVVANHDVYHEHIVGIDGVVPVARRVDIRGEWWRGADLADVRGGIGQGVSTALVAGGREVGSTGGWAEVIANPKGKYVFSLGFSQDHPNFSDLAGANNRRQNDVTYVTNQFRAGGGYELGFNISRWRTEFVGTPTQESMRLELSVMQNF